MTEMNHKEQKTAAVKETVVKATRAAEPFQPVTLQNWTRSANQLWKLEQVSGNKYRIKNVASSLYLDVIGSSTASGAQLNAFFETGGANQEFTFSECNLGLIGAYIIKAFSGMVMEHFYIMGDRALSLMEESRALNQQWVLVNMDNGNCAIFNQRSGWVLGVV